MRRFVAASAVALASTFLFVGPSVAETKSAGLISADADASTAATETLLSFIPSGDRERCYRRDKDTLSNGEFADAVTAVQCDNPADGVTAVIYVQYADTNAMAARYTANVSGVPAGSNTNQECNGTSTWNYNDGTPGGDSACFNIKDGATVVWTATTPLILGVALGTDGTALEGWFNKSAGPLSTPSAVTNFGSAGDANTVAASKALLSRAAKALSNCTSKLSLVSPGDPEWAWYPWLQAAEACDAPQHGSVYLAKLDPASVAAYEAYFKANTIIGNQQSSVPKACKPSDINNQKNKPVGKLSCVYVGKFLYATWYTTDDGVMGSAHVATTPQRLIAYLYAHHLI